MTVPEIQRLYPGRNLGNRKQLCWDEVVPNPDSESFNRSIQAQDWELRSPSGERLPRDVNLSFIVLAYEVALCGKPFQLRRLDGSDRTVKVYIGWKDVPLKPQEEDEIYERNDDNNVRKVASTYVGDSG
jgi:hypothetical protein